MATERRPLASRAAPSATYVTPSDTQFFVGTVAMLNSLRLTGHDGELVVLDCGLSGAQRGRLEEHARVVSVPVAEGRPRHLYKASVADLAPTGLVVAIDSDVLVTGSLAGPLLDAQQGRISAFPERRAERRFASWQTLLGLAAPVREQPYVNAGFVAFSTERWPGLLARWQEVCRLVPGRPRSAYRPFEASADDPFAFPDQDALNALLATEVPAGAVSVWDRALAPRTPGIGVSVLDAGTLRCANDGRGTLLLHATGGPKPWERLGWSGAVFGAFVELLPRVLLADDVPLRLRRAELPVWLWDGLPGRASFGALRLSAESARRVVHALPPRARRRLLLGARARVWQARFKP